MKIENNVLSNVTNDDINPDGTFTFPEGVTKIEKLAFEYCGRLKKIEIPNEITEIGKQAFYKCVSLKEITIPYGVTKIDKFTFDRCTSLKEIEISEGVTSIEGHAFWNCTSLKKIIIPKSVTRIRQYTFFNCKSLEKVIIPYGVTSIDYCAFNGCSALSNFSVGNIDILKLYEASKQSIDGMLFQIEDISNAAAFATLSDFFITDGNFSFKCNYENSTFKIEEATPETKKYAQKVLMPLFLQIQTKKSLFDSSRTVCKI